MNPETGVFREKENVTEKKLASLSYILFIKCYCSSIYPILIANLKVCSVVKDSKISQFLVRNLSCYISCLFILFFSKLHLGPGVSA